MNNDTSLISDNEGESIGSVGNYVNRFKDIEVRSGSTSDLSYMYTPKGGSPKASSAPNSWEDESKATILAHYYRKIGDGTLNDFEEISVKVAIAINRVYSLSLTEADVLKMLSSILDKESFQKETLEKEDKEDTLETTPKKAIKVSLAEGDYSFISGREPLSKDNLELVPFLDTKSLCFSSNGDSSFYLALKKGSEDSFEKLFNFSPREKVMLDMYSDTLGDEAKAKKLVLIARGLNDDASPSIGSVKKTVRKKAKKVTGTVTSRKVTKKVAKAK